MIHRRKSKQIYVGSVPVGGDAPVSVQSMCTTPTWNIDATVGQIINLKVAGCDIIRVAVPVKKDAEALPEIISQVDIPVIADIHFSYKLALMAIDAGVAGLRLNPGNIGNRSNTEKVVKAAREKNIPIRIGVNAGSLEKSFDRYPIHEAMVMSALNHVHILEDLNYDNIKISLKSSDVPTMIEAYKLIADKVDYPLHLGVTEAGTLKQGLVKSSVGIGTLLAQGIGDTIRISLTEDPIEEVYAGYEVLKALGLREKGLSLVSCPSCGRVQIDLIGIAKKVEEALKNISSPLTVAVMGCVVNGPGEAIAADIGIAGGDGKGIIFKNGQLYKTVAEHELLDELLKEVENMTQEPIRKQDDLVSLLS